MGKYFPKIPKIAPGQPGHGAMHQFLRRGPAPAPTATSAATAPATSAADPPSPPPTSAPTAPSGASLSLPSVPSTSTDTRVDVHHLLDAPSASHASNALDASNAPSDAELRVSHSTPITKLRGSPYDRPNANNGPVPASSSTHSTKKHAPIIISDDEDDRMIIESTDYASASLSKTTFSPSSTLLTLPSPIDSVFPITPGSTIHPPYPNDGEPIENDGETPESELDIASSKLDEESAADADDEASDDDDDEMEEDEDGEVFWDAMEEAAEEGSDAEMDEGQGGRRDGPNESEGEVLIRKRTLAATPVPSGPHKKARLSLDSKVILDSYSPITVSPPPGHPPAPFQLVKHRTQTTQANPSEFFIYRTSSSSIDHPTGSRYSVLEVDPLPDEDDTITNPSPEARQIPSLEPPIAAINDAEDDAEMADGDSNKEENAEVKSESKKAKRKGQNMRRRVKLRASASLLSSSEHSDGNSSASFVCSSSNLEGDSDDSNNSNNSDDSDDSINNSDDSASSSSSLSSSTSSRSPSPVRKNRKTRVQKDKNQRAKNRRKEKARRLASAPSPPRSHPLPAPPPPAQSSSSAPITYTSKGKARIPMSTNPKNVARRGTKAEAFSEAARQKREAAAATLKAKIIPFDQSWFKPSPNDSPLDVIKAKSRLVCQHEGKRQITDEEWELVERVGATMLPAAASYARAPTRFDPRKWPEALRLDSDAPVPASNHARSASRIGELYTRLRFTARSTLSEVVDDLSRRAPQDLVFHDYIRKIIAASEDEDEEDIGESYNGTTFRRASTRAEEDKESETKYMRIRQRLAVKLGESDEDIVEAQSVFAAWVWYTLNQEVSDEHEHLKAPGLHVEYPILSLFEEIINDCGKGGVCYNAAPGGEFGAWYAAADEGVYQFAKRANEELPLPELHPVPEAMVQAVDTLINVIRQQASSDGIELAAEFLRNMRMQMMPAGVTAHGKTPKATVLKDARLADLNLETSMWGRYPGFGPWVLLTVLDLVDGRTPSRSPQGLDAEGIANLRFTFTDIWPYGIQKKDLARFVLFTCAWLHAIDPAFISIQSEPVFAMFYHDYFDLTDCEAALAWTKAPTFDALPQAADQLAQYWTLCGMTLDPHQLGNTREYAKNIGERFLTITGDVRREVLVHRHCGAGKYMTVAARQEEQLLVYTTEIERVLEHAAHNVSGKRRGRDKGGFMSGVSETLESWGLQSKARSMRVELYEIRGAYAVLQQSARSQRETDAADALGPAKRTAFDYDRSAAASHGFQTYTARSPRAIGAPNSAERIAEGHKYVRRFKDCDARNVPLPLDLPLILNPLHHEKNFLLWHDTRAEGKLLWRAAHAAQGWAGAVLEVLLARKGQIAAEGRKYAETRRLLGTIGSFTRAITSQVALQLSSRFNFYAPRLGSHPDNSLWAIACPNCPDEPLAYGTRNSKHACPNASTSSPLSCGKLNHTSVATPHLLLSHDSASAELLKWAQTPESCLCIAPIDDYLPEGIDHIDASAEHPGVLCIHHIDQLGHPSLQRFMEFQAMVAFIVEHHEHSPFDEYWTSFADVPMMSVLEQMRSPEKGKRIMVTGKCEKCCYRAITVLPIAQAKPGLRLEDQHYPRNGGIPRPPLQYLPRSYAEAEFVRRVPVTSDELGESEESEEAEPAASTKKPRAKKRSGKRCPKHQRPKVSHRLECFWDLPLVWKIRVIIAICFEHDEYHKLLAGWTMLDAVNWKQSK